jgi:putative transposase
MPSRIFPFVNGQYYHIYNRGIEKRRVFANRSNLNRFISSMIYYQLEGPKSKFSNYLKRKSLKYSENKIVDILCYCLMPNHFHFLLKQLKDNGVSEFTSKLTNSYTRYFNTKNNRVGPLFQGEFKAVMVESDEQLLHLSRYIHLNPLVSYLVKELKQYEWSSYNEYKTNQPGICAKEDVLAFFKKPEKYQEFVHDQEDYALQLQFIKHHTLEPF